MSLISKKPPDWLFILGTPKLKRALLLETIFSAVCNAMLTRSNALQVAEYMLYTAAYLATFQKVED